MNALLFRCLIKIGLLLVAAGCLAIEARATTDSLPPPALQQQLDQYRQANQLDAWLYARIDYVEAAPLSRIVFLMNTQAAAWRSYQTYDERLAWFNLLLLQGYYQLQTGNILASIKGYEAALQFYEAYPLPDADNIVDYMLKPLGNNYTRLGDYEAALYIHQKTLQLVQATNNRQEMASVYNNMAICTRWQGDLAAAKAYCRQGLQLVQRSTPLYGLLLSTQADVYTEAKQYDSAARIAVNAITQLRQHLQSPEARYWYGSALQAAAQVARRQERYAEAGRYAQQALTWFEQYFPQSRPREKARIEVLLGNVYLAQGQARAALNAYHAALVRLLPAWSPVDQEVVPDLLLLYSESLLADALTGKAQAFTQLGQKAKALRQYQGVFQAVHSLKQAFLHTSARLQEMALAKGRADSAMALAYDLSLGSDGGYYKEQMLLIAEHTKSQVLAYERAQREPAGYRGADSNRRKMIQLQEAIGYYQRELAAAPQDTTLSRLLKAAEYELHLIAETNIAASARYELVTVSRLRTFLDQLPPTCTVLEFFAGNGRSYILELDRRGVQQVRVINGGAATEKAVRTYLQDWYLQGPSAMLNEPRAFYAAGLALYRQIFGDYHWDAQRRYLLIPDGQYSYLPFDALPVRDAFANNYSQWPYLLSVASTSQAYSLQTWYQQQTAGYGAGGFTGFFVSKGQQTGQPVLSVQQEYSNLQQQINGAYYLDTAATWQQFTAHAGDQGVLHISSHAVGAGNDSLPYLQLYDQPFYLFDLRFRQFSPSLVVLGACKTADGNWLDGEGVNSLSRAFTGAGAGGVIAGRWNVHDQAAIDILQHLYVQLAGHQDAAAALQAAKRHYLQQQAGNNRLSLPYYWAALTYSGHMQPVPLVRADTGITWYWWAGGILLLLLLLAWRKFA